MSISDETRKKIYCEKVPALIAQPTEEQQFEYDGHKCRIKLLAEETTEHYGLKTCEGQLFVDGEAKPYEFFVKYNPGPNNKDGLEHLLENVRSARETLPFTTLSCGDIAPFTYHISEAAGKALPFWLSTDYAKDTLLAIVANNIFGVSKELIDSELKYDHERVEFCSKEKFVCEEPGIFQKGISRLLHQTERRYTDALELLDKARNNVISSKIKLDPAKKTGDQIPILPATQTKLTLLDELISAVKQNYEKFKEIKTEFANKYADSKIPALYTPTDLVSVGQHIRIKPRGKVFHGYVIDCVLGDNESAAGTPHEVYERLQLSRKETGKVVECMGPFLDKLCELIRKEYIGDAKKPPRDDRWVAYAADIQKIMEAWIQAKNDRSDASKRVEKVEGKNTTIDDFAPKNDSSLPGSNSRPANSK